MRFKGGIKMDGLVKILNEKRIKPKDISEGSISFREYEPSVHRELITYNRVYTFYRL